MPPGPVSPPPDAKRPSLRLAALRASAWSVEPWLLPLTLAALLAVASVFDFLIFHAMAELFACMVGIVMFVVVLGTRGLTRNDFLLWIGSGYFWLSILDLLHTLSYKGMRVLPGDDANLATQFWVAARLLQGVTLVAAPVFLTRRISPPTALAIPGALAVGQYAVISAGLYPTAYVEGVGLTTAKIAAEYAVVGLLVLAAIFLWRRRALVDATVLRMMGTSLALTALSELMFTRYVGVTDMANVVGHILKFAAFWVIFQAIVRTTLTQPFRNLARTASTYDAIPDPTLLVGADARIVQANRATAEEFSTTVRDLVGLPIHDLLHPGEPRRNCPDCAALAAGLPLRHREIFHPDTGHTYQVSFTHLRAGTNNDGQIEGGTVVVLRDITARRRAEDAVRTHTERLAMALDNGDLGLWDWNIQTGSVFYSSTMETMLGYDAGSWERHVSSWQHLVHPDDYERVQACLADHLEGRAPAYECEHRVRRADGGWAWVLDKGKVVERDARGQPLRAVGTHTNITVLKQQQDALADKSRRLEESNRDLEQFAYVASHDLQEPLRMVSGYLTLVRRRYGDSLDDQGREFVNLAVDGAARMSRLISDLLDYSRVSTRGQDFEAVPAGEAVAAALENLHIALEDSGGRVTVAPDLPTVRADRAQLERLFQNFIGNAVKYRAADRAPVISVTTEAAPPGFAAFAITDNGIGIPEADQDRIFQIFTRLHGRTEYEGTGIGLAVCKRIIDRHGGTVRVRSAPGQGSTFLFTLPLADASAAAPPARTPIPA